MLYQYIRHSSAGQVDTGLDVHCILVILARGESCGTEFCVCIWFMDLSHTSGETCYKNCLQMCRPRETAWLLQLIDKISI